MKNNNYNHVYVSIADTQDGKRLNPDDVFSKFIIDIIDRNTRSEETDTEEIESDFRYMIDQLKKALKPVEDYNSEQINNK